MTGVIILAAGSSSRMGEPKQNLIFKGKTLLQTAVKAALTSKSEIVAVVLGGNASIVSPTITNQSIHIFINDDWKAGMGTTISCGLNGLLKIKPDLSSVVFMLVDQPFVKTALINELIEKTTPGKIVACSYNNTLGPPVVFDQSFFDDLLALRGNEGAKKLLHAHQDAVIEIPFPLGTFDIDTPEDYDRINKM